VLQNIYVINQRRKSVLFKREDINEYESRRSDYWTDEVDDNIIYQKELLISNFIEVQKKYLESVIGILDNKVSVERIEDLITDSKKMNGLKEWLLKNEYYSENYYWNVKKKGSKTSLAFILSFVIPLKGFSDIQTDYETLIKVALNSFGVSMSKSTFEKAMNSDSNHKLREEFKNLFYD